MNTAPKSKTIVCYGDSNTYGAVPVSGDRYPAHIRWTGVLQDLLGTTFEVISEGLSGRTLVVADPEKSYRTGITHLQSILKSHDPIDLLIIMLGTNDVKEQYHLSAEGIARHLEQTIQLIQAPDGTEKIPKILVVCPPAVVIPESNDLDRRMIRGVDIFKELPNLYKQVSENYSCEYLNASDYISLNHTDGYHLDKEAHHTLGKALFEKIKSVTF